MELSLSSEIANISGTQEILSISRKPTVYYYADKSSTGPCSEPDQSNP
jgi:hypothetical protein